jgi:hypothetical protein
MAFLFRREERARHDESQVKAAALALVEEAPEHTRRAGIFFAALVGVMIFGAWLHVDPYFPEGVGTYARLVGVLLALAGLTYLATLWFGKEETREWGRQTWLLLRMIVPIFVVAVIAIAVIVNLRPLSWVMSTAADTGGLTFGDPEGNSPLPVFIAAVFSTLMYFPMLAEVAFTKGLLLKNFALGPALALLLGGPGLSLPGLALVSKVAGWKKMLAYWVVMVSLITIVAMFFGYYFGKYECYCQRALPPPPAERGPLGLLGLGWYGALATWLGTMLAIAWRSRTRTESAEETA